MPNAEMQAVRELLSSLPNMEDLSIEETRALYNQLGQKFPLPDGVLIKPAETDQISAEWVRASNTSEGKVILYLHGGGYIIGSPVSHRHQVSAICLSAFARALVLNYRLAPENPHPAAVEDAVTAYGWLLEQGIDPKQIVIAGDSAGGGLTIATLISLRDKGVALPAAAVCISPWVDLTNSAGSYKSKAEADPLLRQESIDFMAQAYLQGQDPKTPLASPLFADLQGLPPLLIQVGTEELLLDDANNLERRAKEAGVEVTLEVWEEMIHVWHYFYPMLEEGRKAIARVGAFIKAKVDQ
jgi:epsilon-lactone hydrolase